MSIHKTFFQVDAFTAAPFKGNPAGVCLLERDMPKKWMQNVATEMNLSETAFVTPENDHFRIRFFTPETEVPLCGHGTLSSAHVLYQTGIAVRDKKIRFESRAGELFGRKSGNWIILDFPSYGFEPMQIPDSAAKLIGIQPVELYRTSHGWTMVLLHNEEDVRNLQPDFSRMKNSPFGDLIVTAPSEDTNFDFCVRCFAPAVGINEDPVTGSAHCALTPFWHKRTGRTEFFSRQVSQRSGILKVAMKDNRVEIAGHAKTVLRGELLV
ncbi:MAG TPA: PhzF family phenazine biosynthesis protein [Bacteroidales bacterium]|nr:PhzF family phenazine biosynthesis protein [Bacteroidales bacterium]